MEKKVLFVDDEQDILNALRRVFHACGYAPRFTMDGGEALNMAEQEEIPVVFTDLRMPIMDGIELCRRMKALRPQTRVYAVSAYVSAYTADQLREAGFDGWFKKPFDATKLLDVCGEAFAPPDQA